jgi:hypothetical protein
LYPWLTEDSTWGERSNARRRRDIQRDRRNLIIKFLWEIIDQASEVTIAHAQRKVLADWSLLYDHSVSL